MKQCDEFEAIIVMHHLPQCICVLTYVHSNIERLVIISIIDCVMVGGYASGNRLQTRWPFAPCCWLQARAPRACFGQLRMREWDVRRIGDTFLQVFEMV